jgi:hypothetical protein
MDGGILGHKEETLGQAKTNHSQDKDRKIEHPRHGRNETGYEEHLEEQTQDQQQQGTRPEKWHATLSRNGTPDSRDGEIQSQVYACREHPKGSHDKQTRIGIGVRYLDDGGDHADEDQPVNPSRDRQDGHIPVALG